MIEPLSNLDCGREVGEVIAIGKTVDCLIDQMIDQIRQKTAETRVLYYRLVLLLSSFDEVAGVPFQHIAEQTGFPLINVSLALSERMVGLKPQHRALRAMSLLDEIIDEAQSDTVLLANIELLFEPSLRQDPLALLQRLSRRRTVVAMWAGSTNEGYLIYAEPEHPEYRRYPVQEVVVIQPEKFQ